MTTTNKHNVLAVFCLLAAIILGISSSALTAQLFYSFDSKSWFGYVLAAVGLAIDFGKFAFPAVAAYQFQREKFISPIVFGFLTIVCIVVSFLASMAYDANQVNSIANDTIIQSGAYQRQQEVFETTSNSIEATKQDIATMKENRAKKEAQIRSEYQPRIDDAKRRDFLTTPKIGVADLTAERDKKIAELDTAISTKEIDLKKLEFGLQDINKGFATVGTQIKTTKGIQALAEMINPEDPESTIAKINILKNILIEVVAIAFSMAFGFLIGSALVGIKLKLFGKNKNNANIPVTKSEIKPELDHIITHHNQDQNFSLDKATVDHWKVSTELTEEEKELIRKHREKPAAEKSKIGFQVDHAPSPPTSSKIQGVDDEILTKYIDRMYATKNGNEVDGRVTIANEIGIKPNRATLIYGHLRGLGIVAPSPTRKNQTIVLVEKTQAINKLGLI